MRYNSAPRMRSSSRFLFWLIAVVAVSALVLGKLEQWEQNRLDDAGTSGPTVTVMLVGYADKEFPGKEGSDTFKKTVCGDVMVPYEMPAVSKRLKSVLHALASFHPHEGLHNPMHEHGIDVLEISDDYETVMVNLVGEPDLGGKCDRPRLKMQIEETIKLSTALQFELLLNGSAEEYVCMANVFGYCE